MKYTAPKSTRILLAEFDRPSDGPRWQNPEAISELPASGLPGWASNGGPTSKHPRRGLPSSLKCTVPAEPGQLVRIYITGVFAEWAETDRSGEAGAVIELWDDHECIHRYTLVAGRHYCDASNLSERCILLGDGASVETVGAFEQDNRHIRIDTLTLDLPAGILPSSIVFRDLGTPASFTVFDVGYEFQQAPGCPFRSTSGEVSLTELASIVRVGDRNKLERALRQLAEALQTMEGNLDEAKSAALMFLGVVCTAAIELGGSRQVHSVPLAAARQIDQLESGLEISDSVRTWVELCLADILGQGHGLSKQLMDRSMELIDRHYAKDISDATMADKLGLSTSHFRALFRQATGQPFHRYLIAVRLEKAKQLLVEQEMSVNEIATAVGFATLSHFSRAFSQRFDVCPSTMRRLGR